MYRNPLSLALVLFGLPLAGHRAFAQEPDVWPQDENYADQQSNYPSSQYTPPQAYPNQGQGYPQQNYAPTYRNPAYANAPQGYGQNSYDQATSGQIQPLSPEQLEQLVAPIALYPDALLAQILAASTYPAQIAAADQWMRGMAGAPPEQIAAGANAQSNWDPSVKALTAYPQVLSNLDSNLQWTTDLGNAYYNQPQDLLQTVQVMRSRAQQAGTLQNTPQEQVNEDQGYIQLAPANPQVVYVPTYNPWAVYGQPIAPYPDYSPLDGVGSVLGTAVQYGLGFAVSAFTNTPFGLLSWGLDWLANSILFNHSAYCTRSYEVADWGFRHGGPRAFGYGGRGYGERGYGGRWGGEYGHRDGYGRNFAGAGGERGFNRLGSGLPINRPGQQFAGRNGSQFNHGTGYPISRPNAGFQGRNQNNYGRGSYGFGATHPSIPQQYAYNHPQAPISRPQSFMGGSQGFAGRSQGYPSRPQAYGGYGFSSQGQRPGSGGGYSNSPSFRAPSPSLGQGGSYGGGRGNAFAPSQHSGGFHLFGGGHNNSQNYGGGGHAFSGGGHSFGGGGHAFTGGGGHGFGGGGGHSFSGGGHSFGGGGGHSSGGHSGGGGHHH